MTETDLPVMSFDDFRSVATATSDYMLRHLGTSPDVEVKLTDLMLAEWYADYVNGQNVFMKGFEAGRRAAANDQPMTVVIWKDRHSDTTAHLFTDRAAAETWARAKGHEYDRHGHYSEETYPDGDLYITYNSEGDTLIVTDVVPDKDLSEAE